MTLRVLPEKAGDRAVFGGPFRLFEYREHNPLVYLDHPWTGLFLEGPQFVTNYRQLLPRITSIALDEAKSRVLAAELADALDRKSVRRDAGSAPRA